jgi:mRNA interferase MazF
MKFKIVLINFPFDDLAGAKLRPALCLTNYISRFNHIVFAAITSNISNATEPTDIIIEINDETSKTGLKTSSVLKTHRIVTASKMLFKKLSVSCLHLIMHK